MIESYSFKNAKEFEAWLQAHYYQDEGIYLIFDKKKQSSTLTSEEALDLALCYGWIDGVLKRLDDQYYQKYFKKRAKNSVWSNKNIKRVEELTRMGFMKPSGLEAVRISKIQGRYVKEQDPTGYNLEAFITLVRTNSEQAHENLLKMSPSVRRAYALSYYSLKKDESKQKRLEVIIKRLIKNLKPMDADK